ncbi:MAG: YfjI family protein [Parasphingorhabdus sp.]|uniref:YfjI family protein n=1 Tax=Parasphingorhabdus sp. TaxID=2709688 RepID=UPI003296AE5A
MAFDELTKEENIKYRAAYSEWRDIHDIWMKKKERLKTAIASGKKVEEAQAAFNQMEEEPQEPMSPKRMIENPTTEGLYKFYQISSPSLGLFSDEGGVFLGGHSMSAENRLTSLASFSKLWDGAGLDRVRAGDGSSTLYGRRFCVGLMLQGVAAAPLFADPMALEQGFLARCLITEPESHIGKRTKPVDAAAVEKAQRLSRALFSPLLDLGHPTEPDNPQELLPHKIALHPDAKKILEELALHLENEMNEGSKFEAVRGFASKTPEQAARIAGVLTYAKHGGYAPTVNLDVMKDAITLAQFYLEEALRLVENGEVAQEIAEAEKLSQWLRKKWPAIAKKLGRDPRTIIPRDVVRAGPNSMRQVTVVKALLKTLAENGHVVKLPHKTEVDGVKRSIAYRIAQEDGA